MDLISKKSKIDNAGIGLFSKKQFKKGDYVVTYSGDVLSNDEIYKFYCEDKENYIKNIHPFVRDFSNNVIIGKINKDIDKCGVLVNDYAKLKSTNQKDIQEYVKLSLQYANVKEKIPLRGMAPEYVAIKRIKKNEEIYVHYGIGWWLMQLGVSAQEVDKLNKTHDFQNYY